MAEGWSTGNMQTERFDGFSTPCYTQVPNEFFDELMADLSMAEMRVVLYIARRTLGFGRRSDQISVNTLQHGITGSDGRKLDKGTGLSYDALRKALVSLKEKNIIEAKIKRAPDGGQLATEYSLVFRRVANTPAPPASNPTPTLSKKQTSPLSEKQTPLERKIGERKNTRSQAAPESDKGWSQVEREKVAEALRKVSQGELGELPAVVVQVMERAARGKSAKSVIELLWQKHREGFRPGTRCGPRQWAWFPSVVKNHYDAGGDNVTPEPHKAGENAPRRRTSLIRRVTETDLIAIVGESEDAA